jgi:uncharacterized protein (DUF608 family)
MTHGQLLVQGSLFKLNDDLKSDLFFSAYCGGLHIAALRACIEMAKIMNDKDAEDEYGLN